MASDAREDDAGDRIEALRRRARGRGGATGSDIDVRAFRPGDDGPLADFAIPDGESEVDRYWVNARTRTS